jgi:Zn-dependent peptidase ImmA (M78 family)
MKLRRGFKKEAEEYAIEYRQELSIATDGALCPFRLAASLEIPVVPLSHLSGFEPSAVDYRVGETEFFAATVHDGTFKMIVHNDTCHPNRQRSDVMHEISHIALGHPPHPPLTEGGCRNFSPALEYEAKELSCALLIPKTAAKRIVSTGMSLREASMIYGASADLIEYRIRITDARRWYQNSRRASR